jgi:hypothetical protein
VAEPRRTASRLLALLVPLALLAPATAFAEKVTTEDTAGDVQSFEDLADAETFAPAPDNTAFDVTRTVAAYGRTRLQVGVHFTDLLAPSYAAVLVRIHTSGRSYDALLVRRPGSRAEATLQRRNREIDCGGIRTSFDGEGDLVSLSVPASCVGSPRWVQLGVAAIGPGEAPADDQAQTYFFDDAYRDSVRANSLGKGPRIRRG